MSCNNEKVTKRCDKKSKCGSKREKKCKKTCDEPVEVVVTNECSSCGPYVVETATGAGDLVRLELDLSTERAVVRPLLADPSFRWASQTQTDALSNASVDSTNRGIVTDCHGSIYVVGTIRGTATFGTITVTTPVQTPFIAKLNYDGVWQWVFTPIQDTLSDANGASGIAIDCDENLYVTGAFTGTIQWADTLTPLVAGANTETYVVKLTTDGTFIWENQSTAIVANTTQSTGIITDCTDGIYITGTIRGGPVSFGTTTLIPSGVANDGFIAKIDSTGAWIWANQTTTPNDVDTHPSGITNDCQGNVYIVGSVIPGAIPGIVVFATPSGPAFVSSIGLVDAFIAKASSLTGEWLQVNQTNAAVGSVAIGTSITSDCLGNIFTTGAFAGTVTFGDETFTTNSSTIFDAYVSKFSKALQYQWTLDVPGNNITNPGEFANISEGAGITTDCQGNVFTTGTFAGAVVFGDQTLTAANSSAYITKITPDGQWAGAIASVGGSDDIASGFAITSNCQGNIYAIGTFSGTVSFGGTELTSVHVFDPNNDIFVVNVVSDRTIHLIGQAGASKLVGELLQPVFDGTTVTTTRNDLIPSFEYLIQEDGTITEICRCSHCGDTGSKYYGTACSTTSLIINPA